MRDLLTRIGYWVLLLGLGVLVFSPSVRANGAGMGFDEARHLLNRSGFGASPGEIAEFSMLTREQAVERLLRPARTVAAQPVPAWVNEAITPPRQLRDAGESARKAFQQEQVRRGFELRGWWLAEMIVTPSPLVERMTLFWHNHFVSSQQKVRYVQLMYRQNLLLRQHALGNFAALLHAAAKDPAMILYLDSASNRKGQPNENFAREVMELFTMGEGQYGEADIREAARAFTGWSIEPETGEYRWRPFLHDEGQKTVLGASGNFDGDAVLDILLARPATAEFITRKLWREFVSPLPDEREVRRIAARFRESGYDTRTALRWLLLSPAFWSQEARGSLVKSPADLVVGTVRSFQFQTGDALPFAMVTASLGQNLFAPPNVKGWPGGEAWINSSTLLARKQFLERLFRAQEMPPQAMSNQAMADGARMKDFAKVKGQGRLGEEGRERFVRALTDIHFDSAAWFKGLGGYAPLARRAVLATDPVNDALMTPGTLAEKDWLRQLVLDPAFQLK
jgi:uncharacterized protein (DUF1800 family)